ncbi:hypothetical protein [Kordiimonas pumila]|uniref:Uncharacterized protein n=1 Tax=Kordiimonas pumila TaxID=2161677 RepID=A0ABV7D2Q8_9PROT|nr:hypothetical protein [Kordiimonas pumila]
MSSTMQTTNSETLNHELLVALSKTVLKKWGLDEGLIHGMLVGASFEEMSGLITLNRLLREQLGSYKFLEYWLMQPAFYLRGISPIHHIHSIGLPACPDIALAFHISVASRDSGLTHVH